LADHTTFRLGGPAGSLRRATNEADLIEAVQREDAAGRPVLILGGGSNVLVSDEGFPGLVVLVATDGCRVDQSDPGRIDLTVAAGQSWDGLVAQTVERGWSGLEALSGVPGTVGAAPIQNIGAYGAEVAEAIVAVRAWDRSSGRIVTWPAADCRFVYRGSRFKAEPGRHLILSVDFRLWPDRRSQPVRYAELADRLGVAVGQRADLARVRQAVLELRRAKAMLVDPAVPDSWGVGSFFTNPVLSAESAAALPAEAPRFAQEDGRVKLSAAWLIERAGFERGHGLGAARLSSRHVLALTNQGGATAAQVMALAAQIRRGVEARFGVRLEVEPTLVGLTLD
jgi:UDP-N-acetylmuramate dehydrogenase